MTMLGGVASNSISKQIVNYIQSTYFVYKSSEYDVMVIIMHENMTETLVGILSYS